MQDFTSSIAHGEANNKGAIGVAKGNRCDDQHMTGCEWFRHVVAEGVVAIGELHRWIGRWKRLPVVHLVNILDVLVDNNAADLVEWQAESERAVGCSV